MDDETIYGTKVVRLPFTREPHGFPAECDVTGRLSSGFLKQGVPR